MFQKLRFLKKNKAYIMECNISRNCELTEINSRLEVRNDSLSQIEKTIMLIIIVLAINFSRIGLS